MAKIRNFKKAVRYLASDLASETLLATEFVKGFDRAKTPDLIEKIAKLQAGALGKTKFAFDKTPRDFENKAQYNKAKRKYYREAFEKLNATVKDEAVKIVDEMNAAMPKA